jgi:hypothetical protein
MLSNKKLYPQISQIIIYSSNGFQLCGAEEKFEDQIDINIQAGETKFVFCDINSPFLSISDKSLHNITYQTFGSCFSRISPCSTA